MNITCLVGMDSQRHNAISLAGPLVEEPDEGPSVPNFLRHSGSDDVHKSGEGFIS